MEVKLRDLDRCGYPFYIRLNGGLTSQFISFHGNYCKDIWVTYPLIEIQVIKDWLPVAKPKGPNALFKERQRIIETAINRMMKANGDFDDWDEIPF